MNFDKIAFRSWHRYVARCWCQLASIFLSKIILNSFKNQSPKVSDSRSFCEHPPDALRRPARRPREPQDGPLTFQGSPKTPPEVLLEATGGEQKQLWTRPRASKKKASGSQGALGALREPFWFQFGGIRGIFSDTFWYLRMLRGSSGAIAVQPQTSPTTFPKLYETSNAAQH